MLPKVLEKAKFDEFINGLVGRYAVVGPQLKERTRLGEEKFVFGPVTQAADLRMDYNITVLSPRKYFLPQRETLLKFDLAAKPQAAAVVDATQRILVGVHPCDAYATWLLDIVFSSNHQDPNYMSRRERALIIALDCNKPCDEYSYCHDMGTNYIESGFDLMMTDIGDAYFVEIAS